MPDSLFTDASPQTVHFIGICGTAMASVAMELHRSGIAVTGSDTAFYPPMGDLLAKSGVRTFTGYSPVNLPNSGLVVVGNAVSRGNVEMEAALNRRLPLISLPELISRRYLTSRLPIVVAGTHGKTTTTTMIAYLLKSMGVHPGWLIGGMPLDLATSCESATGELFVMEGDEYDTVWWDKRPKFMHYRPFIGIINAVEFDHSDIYPDLGAVKEAFRKFAGLLPQAGRLIINGDDPNAIEVSQNAHCSVEMVGFKETCHWRIGDISQDGEWGITAEITAPENASATVSLGLMGRHNMRNAVAALASVSAAGGDWQRAIPLLKSFKGVARRLQLIAESGGVSLWDDFGHHPTAVRETLAALRRRYPGRRLLALFEPRSNTMVRRYLMQELIDALKLADVAIIAPLHRKEKIPEEQRLDIPKVIRSLKGSGVSAYATESFEEVLEQARRVLRDGDVVVTMSNGDFGGIREKLKEFILSQGSVRV